MCAQSLTPKSRDKISFLAEQALRSLICRTPLERCFPINHPQFVSVSGVNAESLLLTKLFGGRSSVPTFGQAARPIASARLESTQKTL